MLEKRGRVIKKSLVLACFLVGFVYCFSFNLVSAVDASVVDINSTLSRVMVSGASSFYAYEIQFNYTGTASAGSTFGTFLGTGASRSYGESIKNSVFYVYESKLDATKTGVDGNANVFNVTHSGDLHLSGATFITSDGRYENVHYGWCGDGVCDSGEDSTSCLTDCAGCGDGICNNGETCSTCSADCGICEVVGGGGGGGGGGTTPLTKTLPVVEGISVDTSEINIYLVLSSNKERIVSIKNSGDVERVVKISSSNLDDIVLIKEETITLAPGESKDLDVRFIAPSKTGIYTGKINIGGKEILVSANVQSKELLFDAIIAVPEQDKNIDLGSQLDVQITLIPMGEDPRVDVTLNYVVKDYNGKTYLEESETILVEGQKNFQKRIPTSGLPTGNYIVGLEVVYPNGVAASSSHFQVVKKEPFSIKNILIVFIAIVLIALIVVVYLFISYRNRRKKILLKSRK